MVRKTNWQVDFKGLGLENGYMGLWVCLKNVWGNGSLVKVLRINVKRGLAVMIVYFTQGRL